MEFSKDEDVIRFNPTITAIAVFSKDEIKTIHICLHDELKYTPKDFRECGLEKVGVFKKYSHTWHEYRVIDIENLNLEKRLHVRWKKTPPGGLFSLVIADINGMLPPLYNTNTVFFYADDRYGYFREILKFREGYSVQEGGDIFVQFLGEAIWNPEFYKDLPDMLRKDILHWLWVCKKLSGRMKGIKRVMIEYLVRMY